MSEPETVDAFTLAEWLGVHERTIRDAEKRGMVVKVGRGRYDLRASILAYTDHLRQGAAGRGEANRLELTEERARLAAEQADAVAIKNRIARGELVEVAVVARAVATEYGTTRERLLAIPGKLSGRLAPDDVDAVDDEISEALKGLHDAGVLATSSAAASAAGGSEAPPEDEPRGVGRRQALRRPEDVRPARPVADVRPAGRVRPDAGRDRS